MIDVFYRLPLLQSPQQGSQVHSGGSIDNVLSHEVKELGTHILVCEVSYSAPGKSKLNFRKFFKFNVMKPLDVKTKFYNAESEDVFLEAQVQNVTAGPLCLEKVGKFLNKRQLPLQIHFISQTNFRLRPFSYV